MKNASIRWLRLQQSLRIAVAENDEIRLKIRRIYGNVMELGYADCITFDIIEKASDEIAGEISLRIGEDAALFYVGHIGYHINPSYRGRRFARHACQLCRPLLKRFGMDTVVITTDEDNLPSIRTCEGLGCELESTVDVPLWYVNKFQISTRKRRYIFWT